CALLTTHVLIVDPARLAPTSTPSIGPSADELTTPVSAAAAVPSAAMTRMTHVRASAVVAARMPARCFLLIARLLLPYPNDSNDPNDPNEVLRRPAEESEIHGFAEDVSLNRRENLRARVERIRRVGGNIDLGVEREQFEHVVMVRTVGRRAGATIDAVAGG